MDIPAISGTNFQAAQIYMHACMAFARVCIQCPGADPDILVWGGCTMACRSRNLMKIQAPLEGSGGMPPQESFNIYIRALRQLLVRSEANCL